MLRSTISLTAIVIAGAIFFLYTQPAYDKTKAIHAQIASYDQALEKAAELQTLKQQLLDRYNSFPPADIARLQKLLPDHVDNIRLILDMDDIAMRDGMTLSNVDISGNNSTSDTKTVIGALGASAQKYDTLAISFTTNGTYTQFKKFLTDLQSSLRIVDMTSLKIGPGGGGGAIKSSEPIFAFGINLKTYWLK